MQPRASRILTHVEAYRRLLAGEAERLRTANLRDRRQRRAILKHLRAVRLSARDLEEMLEREGDGAELPDEGVAAE